ncbi:LytR/AlgR family response regulator transcription factor [Olivibacter jilunii]|uniref:LytR/AlgR family response regulator transcription factor n=1 Tax=Olivibacter jilunii TaxID=985016 RepID=UPI003F15EF71
MIKAIAIDDEPIALGIIQKLAEKVPFLQIDSTFTNAYQAIEYLQVEKVDLLFLDIKMPDISGIDFYDGLYKKPFVIFTTAYAEHALKGFDLDAVDYLLKPFSVTRFLKACHKAKNLLQVKNGVTEMSHSILVKSGIEQIRLYLNDLLYIEATGNYVSFVCKNEIVNSRMTLTECEELLPKSRFIRIHRSFIVNTDAVTKIERHQLTAQGYILPISSSYKNKLPRL